ncbi:MAG: hypothetical protein EOP11_12365 [Proteobacteria bacterium]|nr:MAG: hypothetical protein EOP11_12365 [Pseudomonadota bacterium]
MMAFPPSVKIRVLTVCLGLGFFGIIAQAAPIAEEACESALGTLPAFQELSAIYSSLLAKPSLHCTHATTNSCAADRLDTHWHMQAVDGDLMAKEMDAWRKAGNSGGREPIAIVDGLFGPHIGDLLASPPTVDQRSTVGLDKSGHGSQTAQFLTGKDGLGLAVGNPVHAYDVAADEGTVDSSGTTKAVKDACAAGERIINLSINTKKGSSAAAGELSALVLGLAEKGCLLVKAAGNDAIQDSAVLNDYVLDFQLYLSAGATRRTGGIAGFSDLGSVYAPGQDLAVTLPPSQLLTCGVPKNEAILGGTSFAAPIVAAISSQVLEVMKTSPQFRALKPLEQTRNLVRVVRESAESPTGNVSGLRAVRGAMDWVAKAAGKKPPPIDKACGQIAPSCLKASGETDCAAELSCSQSFRQALALCPEKLAKQPLELFLGATKIDPWLGLRLADALRKNKDNSLGLVIKKILAQTYDDDYWTRELKALKSPFHDFDHFVDLFDRVRLSGAGKPGELDERITKVILQVWATGNRVAHGFVNQALERPELNEMMIGAARNTLIEKRTVREGAAVELLGQLVAKQSGEKVDKLALDFTKAFPASERPYLDQYLRAFALGPKRLGHDHEIIELLVAQGKTRNFAEKIMTRKVLDEIADRGRASADDVKAWKQKLD